MRIFDIPDAVRVIFVREKITFSLSPVNRNAIISNGESDGSAPTASVGFFGESAEAVWRTNRSTTLYHSEKRPSTLRELFLFAADKVAQQFIRAADNHETELKRARVAYRKQALAGEVREARENAERVRAITAEIAAAWPEENRAQKGVV